MSNDHRVLDNKANDAVTISFGERFQASEQFDVVFREGMDLVERTANYLDGEGRAEAKKLEAPLNVLYASESMRLTTRLLDLASWLLIRRSLKEGEITEAEARKRRRRVKLQALSRPSHIKGFDGLPSGLCELIKSSFALHDRIVKLDKAMASQSETNVEGPVLAELASNPVGDQLDMLRQAFGRH